MPLGVIPPSVPDRKGPLRVLFCLVVMGGIEPPTYGL